jgi:hypothetical protein
MVLHTNEACIRVAKGSVICPQYGQTSENHVRGLPPVFRFRTLPSHFATGPQASGLKLDSMPQCQSHLRGLRLEILIPLALVPSVPCYLLSNCALVTALTIKLGTVRSYCSSACYVHALNPNHQQPLALGIVRMACAIGLETGLVTGLENTRWL